MTASYDHVWKDACKILQGMLNPDLFNRWFVPIKPMELRDDVLVLGVVNEFSQIWLQDNFLPLVREAVNQSSKEPLQVRFAVSADLKAESVPVPCTPTAKPTSPARQVLDIKLNPRYSF